MTDEEIIKKLEQIKNYIFRNTIAKVDYMKIERETGKQMPFYILSDNFQATQ